MSTYARLLSRRAEKKGVGTSPGRVSPRGGDAPLEDAEDLLHLHDQAPALVAELLVHLVFEVFLERVDALARELAVELLLVVELPAVRERRVARVGDLDGALGALLRAVLVALVDLDARDDADVEVAVLGDAQRRADLEHALLDVAADDDRVLLVDDVLRQDREHDGEDGDVGGRRAPLLHDLVEVARELVLEVVNDVGGEDA